MSIPDYQSLMLPVLIASEGGEVRIRDVVERLATELKLTPDERAELLPSGKQGLFANRVHWAKTYLVKAKLVEATQRGSFIITRRGREVIKAKPARIDNDFLGQFVEFETFRNRPTQEAPIANAWSEAALSVQTETPDEIMRTAHRQIEASLAQELLDRIRNARPEFFERLIVNLLLSMGYGGSVVDAGRAIGRSGDDGIDGVIPKASLSDSRRGIPFCWQI